MGPCLNRNIYEFTYSPTRLLADYLVPEPSGGTKARGDQKDKIFTVFKLKYP